MDGFRNLYCNFWYLVKECVVKEWANVSSWLHKQRKGKTLLFIPRSLLWTDHRVREENVFTGWSLRCLRLTPDPQTLTHFYSLGNIFLSLLSTSSLPYTYYFHFFTRGKSSFTSDLQNNEKAFSIPCYFWSFRYTVRIHSFLVTPFKFSHLFIRLLFFFFFLLLYSFVCTKGVTEEWNVIQTLPILDFNSKVKKVIFYLSTWKPIFHLATLPSIKRYRYIYISFLNWMTHWTLAIWVSNSLENIRLFNGQDLRLPVNSF